MSTLFSFVLHYTSLTPLWLFIAFIDINSIFVVKNNDVWCEIITLSLILLFFVVSIFVLLVFFRKPIEGTKITLVEVNKAPKVTIEFFVTNVVSMIAYDFTKYTELVKFILFFSSVSFIIVKNRIINANILLELFKFNYYQCKDDLNRNIIVISKEKMEDFVSIPTKLISINDVSYFYLGQ